MKQFKMIFLIVMLTLNGGITALASEQPVKISETTDIEFLSNGDYIETVVEEWQTGARASTKYGSKTKKYCNSSDEIMWSVTISGTFSYTYGKTATCTNVTGTAVSYSSEWKVGSVSTSKSGNTAQGSVTGTNIVGGKVINTLSRTVTLSCDKYGNLS